MNDYAPPSSEPPKRVRWRVVFVALVLSLAGGAWLALGPQLDCLCHPFPSTPPTLQCVCSLRIRWFR